ncbi:MAG: hypothetical protein MI757_13320 [Pirellulales bacterium]|nr:hypothetical protein [Pirellulales bacterium]
MSISLLRSSKLARLICLAILMDGASACLAEDPLANPAILTDTLPSEPVSVEKARAAVEKWLNQIDRDGLVLDKKVKDGKPGFRHVDTVGGMYVFRDDGWYVTLRFHKEPTAEMSNAQLRRQIKYVALDRVPLPGLVARGWMVHPKIPRLSDVKGIIIDKYENGRIVMKLKTKAKAIYGLNPRAPQIADAPATPGSTFEIRRELPIELRLEVPLAAKKPNG